MWIGERLEYLSLFTGWESPWGRQGNQNGIGIEFAGSEQAHMPLCRVGLIDDLFVGFDKMVIGHRIRLVLFRTRCQTDRPK
jgi:hypothetical protein